MSGGWRRTAFPTQRRTASRRGWCERFGDRTRRADATSSVSLRKPVSRAPPRQVLVLEEHHEQRFLCVETVLRLIKDHRSRPIHH